MMSKRFTRAMLALLLTALWVVPSFAEFVFVTKNGKKCHPENSKFLQGKEVEKITKEEAESRGLEPSREYLKYLQGLEAEKMTEKGSKK